jgi:hypothetical protein
MTRNVITKPNALLHNFYKQNIDPLTYFPFPGFLSHTLEQREDGNSSERHGVEATL